MLLGYSLFHSIAKVLENRFVQASSGITNADCNGNLANQTAAIIKQTNKQTDKQITINNSTN